MRKYISLAVGIALSVSPIIVSAQTTSTSSDASFFAILTQFVQILQGELQQLFARQNVAIPSQLTTGTQQTNTSSVIPIPSPSSRQVQGKLGLTISSISPSAGPPGTVVTIVGTGFVSGDTYGDGSLIVGDDIIANSDGTRLTFTVPNVPTSGALCFGGCPAPLVYGKHTIQLTNVIQNTVSNTVDFTVSKTLDSAVEKARPPTQDIGFIVPATITLAPGQSAWGIYPRQNCIATLVQTATDTVLFSFTSLPVGCTALDNGARSDEPDGNMTLILNQPIIVDESYVFTLTSVNSDSASIKIENAGSASTPVATIEQASLASTSATPTISGTVMNSPAVSVDVTDSHGDSVYANARIQAINGTWSATISPALAAGNYFVTVHPQYGTSMQATLVLTPSSGPCNIVACITQTPAIISISPASGPPGTKVTLTGSGFTARTYVVTGLDYATDIMASDDGTGLMFTIPKIQVGDASQHFSNVPISPGAHAIAVSNDRSVTEGQIESNTANISNKVTFTVTN